MSRECGRNLCRPNKKRERNGKEPLWYKELRYLQMRLCATACSHWLSPRRTEVVISTIGVQHEPLPRENIKFVRCAGPSCEEAALIVLSSFFPLYKSYRNKPNKLHNFPGPTQMAGMSIFESNICETLSKHLSSIKKN